MSDTQNENANPTDGASEAAPAPTKVRLYATLVRGKTYYLRDKRFEQGQEIEVTRQEMEHLKQHAVDSVTIKSSDGDEQEMRQKFEFREDKGEAAVTRTRVRRG